MADLPFDWFGFNQQVNVLLIQHNQKVHIFFLTFLLKEILTLVRHNYTVR